MRRRELASMVLVVVLLVPPVSGGVISISEVLYDAEGQDDGRTFVELFGPAGLGLAGYRLEGINGSGGGVTHDIDLSACWIPADGFLVVADAAAAGGTFVAAADYIVANLDLQNGPDSVRILFEGTVVDALGYGTFGTAHVFAGEGSAMAGVDPGMSIARRYVDVDSDDNLRDFVALAVPTPGAGDRIAVVPEPASLGLLAIGALLVGVSSRRRRGRSRERSRSS